MITWPVHTQSAAPILRHPDPPGGLEIPRKLRTRDMFDAKRARKRARADKCEAAARSRQPPVPLRGVRTRTSAPAQDEPSAGTLSGVRHGRSASHGARSKVRASEALAEQVRIGRNIAQRTFKDPRLLRSRLPRGADRPRDSNRLAPAAPHQRLFLCFSSARVPRKSGGTPSTH